MLFETHSSPAAFIGHSGMFSGEHRKPYKCSNIYSDISVELVPLQLFVPVARQV